MPHTPRSAPTFAPLLALVEQMLRESADPAVVEHFDAAAWLEQWLATPAAALGGRAPEELVATLDGFDLVQRLLRSQQSGAYW